MFFSLAGRHDKYKSRALKIENLDLHGQMAWRAVAKPSLSAQVKELCWAEGKLACWLLLLDYFSRPNIRRKRR